MNERTNERIADFDHKQQFVTAAVAVP